MNAPAPYYPNYPVPDKGIGLKEGIGLTLLSALAIGVTIHYVKKFVNDKRTGRSDANSFEDGTAATTAKQIKMAFENDGWPGTDTTRLRRIITQVKSKDEMDKVAKEYHNQYPGLLFQDMQDELQSSEYDEMLAIKDGKPQKAGQKVADAILYKAWAKRLKAAFEKMYGPIPGTDTDNIHAVFSEIPSQQAFVNVGKQYQGDFHTPLVTDLKGKLKGDYYKYMTIITKKPKN